VRETETLIATALLLGMDHASRKLNAADEEIPCLPFEEAVSFMKSRIPVTKAEWIDLEPKVRFRAFTVARLAQCDYIDTARQVLHRAMESGKGVAETYKQWQALQTLAQDDAMKLRPGYWENVFRTNTQTAYTAGKLMQFRDNPPPAWRLLIVDDSRTSDICRGLIQEGKRDIAMASDHPFWNKFGFPPYHYQCRTGLQAVYKSEIADGAVVENPDMDDMQTRFKPMEGFGGNPLNKESWWMMTEGMAARAKYFHIIDDVESFAKENGLHNFSLNLAKKPLNQKPPSEIQRMKDILGIDKVKTTGISSEVVREINNSLEDILKEYPQLQGSIQRVNVTSVASEGTAAFTVYYKNGIINTTLTLNTVDLKDLKTVAIIIEDNVSEKFWTPKDGVGGIIRHEMAHALEFVQAFKEKGVDWTDTAVNGIIDRKVAFNYYTGRAVSEKVVQQALKNLNMKDMDWKDLCKYARRAGLFDPKKGMAEAYAEGISDASLQELSKEIIRLSKEEFK